MDGPFPPLPTNRNAAERAIDETLDQLGFATINPHNDCRDHKHSGVRVHFKGDDERCAIYAFAGRPGGLLRYENQSALCRAGRSPAGGNRRRYDDE